MRVLSKNFLRFPSTPHLAKPMLYAVLSIRCVCKYAGEEREIYSFFSVGKKREGKCSFCFSAGKKRWAKTKCAFSFALAYLLCFESANGKIFYTIIKILNSNAIILSTINNFIVSVVKILLFFGNFVKGNVKIFFSVRE